MTSEDDILLSDAADRFKPRQRLLIGVAGVIAAALIALAFIRFGVGWRGLVWAIAQLLLSFLATFDLLTRRIPNRVIVPAMASAVVLRAIFVPSRLAEALVAGAIAFAVFLLFAVMTRGGIGMGDVKLAGLLGLLLGKAALPALLVGAIVGGIASAAVLVAHRGGRGHTIAYAPYLCFGGALAILAFHLPALV